MAVSRTQAVAASTDNVAISSTANNDVILVFAFNSASTTIPSLPSGFSSILTDTNVSQAQRTGFKRSTGGDTTSGTWTNATRVVCMVYAGVVTTGNPYGGHNTSSGNGSVWTYNSLTMTVGDGSSWVIGMGGERLAGGEGGNTTLLGNRITGSLTQGLDSGTGLASYASETESGMANTRWITSSLEIMAAASVTLPDRYILTSRLRTW